MRFLPLSLLVLAVPALAVDDYVTAGANSVVFGPICVPELVGEEWAAVDFDTSSLNITIAATGGTFTTFDYTGGDIDDGPGDATWGDPTTDAVEVDALATGAYTGCILLSVRDEVLDVGSASRWAISISDGGSALMDTEYVIAASLASTIDTKIDDIPTTSEFEARTQPTADYFDYTADEVDLADDAITAAKIATNAIGADEIAADAIGASEVADGAIDAGALASNAITSAKIAADAIGSQELGTGAITAAVLDSTAADEIVDAMETQMQADATGFEVNVVEISGDSTAADNLESYTDGTVTMPVNTECMNDYQVEGTGESGVSAWTGSGTACD